MSLFSRGFQNLFLVFRSLIMMCLDVYFFGLVLCGVHLSSWICRFTSLAKFSAIISSSALSAPFSSPSRTLMTKLLAHLLQYHKSLGLCSFFKCFFFLLLKLNISYCSIFQLTDSFLCFLHSALANELFYSGYCIFKF